MEKNLVFSMPSFTVGDTKTTIRSSGDFIFIGTLTQIAATITSQPISQAPLSNVTDVIGIIGSTRLNRVIAPSQLVKRVIRP